MAQSNVNSLSVALELSLASDKLSNQFSLVVGHVVHAPTQRQPVVRRGLSGSQTKLKRYAQGIYIALRHDAAAHAYWLWIARILRRPIRPTCNRMEVEVVHSWVGGNVLLPLRQAGTLVLTRDEVPHHVRIVRGASHVRRTGFGVRASCVDQAGRVAPEKADHWRATAVLAITILRPVNVRRNKRRLTAV